MSLESGSTRNTLGSQLSTTSSGSSSGSSSKGTSNGGKKKQYWQKDRKIVRILTVIAYIASVSMAAVLLSAYYVFLWTPGQPTIRPVRFKSLGSRSSSIGIIADKTKFDVNFNGGEGAGGLISEDPRNAEAEAYTSPEEPSRVLDTFQYDVRPTVPIISSHSVIGKEDVGEDDDEYQYQPRVREKALRSEEKAAAKAQIPLQYEFSSSNAHKFRQPAASLIPSSDSFPPMYNNVKDSGTEGEAVEESGPIALPLIQNRLVAQILSLTSSSSSHSSKPEEAVVAKVVEEDLQDEEEEDRKPHLQIEDTSSNSSNKSLSSTSSSSSAPSSPSTIEVTGQRSSSPINRANTLPYRRRQIPTPSSPITITRMISSVLIPPTTVSSVIATDSLSFSPTFTSIATTSPSSKSAAAATATTQPMLAMLQTAATSPSTSSTIAMDISTFLLGPEPTLPLSSTSASSVSPSHTTTTTPISHPSEKSLTTEEAAARTRTTISTSSAIKS